MRSINHGVFFVTFDKLKLGNYVVKLVLILQQCEDFVAVG